LLEHPAEAFVFYRREGVSRVICEQKHMGSRAAAARFGKSKALVRSP
jgi:protein phosphatase